MKYAQLLMGLFAGTALGGAVVASTGAVPLVGSGGVTKEQVQQIVRDTILAEPKIILDSVQKYQETVHNEAAQVASSALKDAAIRKDVFEFEGAASIGPKDSKKVVVEFFDYNCPACKFMFKSIEELAAKDKTARVIFREYPIFGPQSETNARIGLAVNQLYPDKYFAFHEKMMGNSGRTDEKTALGYVKDLGLNVEKVKTAMDSKEVAAELEATHKLGEKLKLQGTPSLAIGDELIGHALAYDELQAKLNGSVTATESPAAAQ